MSKFNIPDLQRVAIWEAHDKKCFYCRESIRFTDLHIDHVIPEHINSEVGPVKRIVEEYGLPEGFGVNTYHNLVPCHANCNLRKGGVRFERQTELFYLALTARRYDACIRCEATIRRKQKNENILVALALAIESGNIRKEEIAGVIASMEDSAISFEILQKLKFLDKELIGFVDKTNAERLLDLPLDMSYASIDYLPLEKGADKTIEVRTCREWRKALEDGYDYGCNFHSKVGAHFIMVCGLINALIKAKVADVSYVKDIGVLDIRYLPVTVYPGLWRDECEEITEEAKKGVTIKDWVDSGRLFIRNASRYSIRLEETEGMGFVLCELLRADLNDDGLEEILVYQYSYATHGTLGYGCINIFARNGSESNFVVREFNGV